MQFKLVILLMDEFIEYLTNEDKSINNKKGYVTYQI
jgi:hypothetical protein